MALRPTRRSPEVQQDTRRGLIQDQPGTPGSRIFTTSQGASLPQVVEIGQVEEIDSTRQPTIALKRITLGQAVETDATRQPTLALKKTTAGQATESELAQPMTSRKKVPLGQAVETDAAQTTPPAHASTIGQATETDSTTSLASRKYHLVAQASETDTAATLQGAKRVLIGQAGGASALYPSGTVYPSGTLYPSDGTSTDTAQPITARRSRTVAIGQAAETDAARPVTALKRRALGQANETDTAQSITRLTAHFVPVNQATQFGEAQPIRAWVPFRATAKWRGAYDNNDETPLIDADEEDGVVLIPFEVTDDFTVCGFRLSFYLSHTYDGDLLLRLIAPDGKAVVLSYFNGGDGHDYGQGTAEMDRTIIDTALEDTYYLGDGSPPFVGTFRPDIDWLGYYFFGEDAETLEEFFGRSALGTWNLEIRDTAGADTGTFHAATLWLYRCTIETAAGVVQPYPAGVRRGRTLVAGSLG